MSVEIVRHDDDGTIPMCDLKPGQLAEIVKWSPCGHIAIGHVVQRVGTSLGLVSIGSRRSWCSTYLESVSSKTQRVRVLQDGEMLRVMGQKIKSQYDGD